MVELLEHKIVKTRKDHKCGCCQEVIPCGTLVDMQCLADSGHIYRWYTCKICLDFISDFDVDTTDLYEGDIWNYDEYADYRKEKLKEKSEGEFFEEFDSMPAGEPEDEEILK